MTTNATFDDASLRLVEKAKAELEEIRITRDINLATYEANKQAFETALLWMKTERDAARILLRYEQHAKQMMVQGCDEWRECAERLYQCCLGDSVEMRKIALAQYEYLKGKQ